MHLVIFGLTISSSWGNGHATLWRSLVKALCRRGHTVGFYERDMPYYASARDLSDLSQVHTGAALHLYSDWEEVRSSALRDLDVADLAMVTSFCPDGQLASDLLLGSRAAIKAFYDLDTPVTLSALESGAAVPYLPQRGLGDFDLVLSYTGGRALTELRTRLGARLAAPLYGSVDPDHHHPVTARAEFRANLSYLGTYAEDRQASLQELFLKPAAKLPASSFLIGGALYPPGFPWGANVGFVRHVPPPDHSAFFSSCRATLNITRAAMARYGFCPSGRLFEAAACGAPLVSDDWEGLDTFFVLGREILCATNADAVIAALTLSDAELQRVATRARERTLAEHTGEQRVRELERLCDAVLSGTTQSPTIAGAFSA